MKAKSRGNTDSPNSPAGTRTPPKRKGDTTVIDRVKARIEKNRERERKQKAGDASAAKTAAKRERKQKAADASVATSPSTSPQPKRRKSDKPIVPVGDKDAQPKAPVDDEETKHKTPVDDKDVKVMTPVGDDKDVKPMTPVGDKDVVMHTPPPSPQHDSDDVKLDYGFDSPTFEKERRKNLSISIEEYQEQRVDKDANSKELHDTVDLMETKADRNASACASPDEETKPPASPLPSECVGSPSQLILDSGASSDSSDARFIHNGEPDSDEEPVKKAATVIKHDRHGFVLPHKVERPPRKQDGDWCTMPAPATWPHTDSP